MNTILPAPRDLPARRRAQIRAELERVVTRRRSHRGWFVPVAAATTAVAAVAVAVVFAPWRQDGNIGPAAPPATGAPTVPTGEVAPVDPPDPVFPGLPPHERAAIEAGCAKSVGLEEATLYNLVEDDAGTVGLLYSQTGSAPICEIDSSPVPYNASGVAAKPISWLAGPVTMDGYASAAGGDRTGNREIYAGQPGTETVVGRVSAEVKRVTVTSGGTTQDAKLANGTYLVRFVRPSTWSIPDPPEMPVVRAYNSAGHLLGTALSPIYDGPICYITPDGTVMPVRSSGDPKTCEPAVPWH